MRPSTVISMLALVVACGGVAVAATKGRGKVIHACYDKNGGAMRFVHKGEHCKASEHKLSWNSKGQRGAPGVSAPSADIGVRISAPSSVPSANFYDVTVTVTNSGPNTSWVGLNTTVGGFFVFQMGHAPASDHGTCLPGLDPSFTFTCAIGILDRGQTAKITFSLQACASPGQTITHVAKITGSSFDPTIADNTATAKIAVVTGTGGCG